MSTVSFRIEGLDALQKALRELPQQLADEGRHIVDQRAAAAEAQVKANYEAHRFTGNLARSVQRAVTPGGRFGHAVVIRVKGRHAFWFEHGTAARHTSQGAARGVMNPAPPMHKFVPVLMRERRGMYEDLADLVRAQGLEVSVDAG